MLLAMTNHGHRSTADHATQKRISDFGFLISDLNLELQWSLGLGHWSFFSNPLDPAASSGGNKLRCARDDTGKTDGLAIITAPGQDPAYQKKSVSINVHPWFSFFSSLQLEIENRPIRVAERKLEIF